MGRTSSSKRSAKSKSSKGAIKKYKSSKAIVAPTSHSKKYSSTVKKAARSMLNSTTMGYLGIEKKFYDTSKGATNLSAPTDCSGGEFDPSVSSMISTPVVGDGPQNRDGKRIVIKSCQIKGFIDLAGVNATAGTPQVANPKVFVALVLDTQTNGAQLNSEDVFTNTGAQAQLNVCLNRNLLFADRFRVLKSEIFDMSVSTLSHIAVNAFSFCGVARSFDWYVPMDLVVNFNAGTTADVANVQDNSLHVIAFGTATTLNAITLSYNARIRFTA